MGDRDRQLRVVIVGCGEAAVQKHLRALGQVQGVVCGGLIDTDGEALRRAAERYGLAEARDEGDALLVATPPGAHLEASGGEKPVMVEKPLCLSAEDCLRFAEMAQRRTVLVGFHMRHHRLVSEARTWIQQGRVGRIESVHVRWASPREDEGLPRWRFRRESGGGAIWEIGMHAYDLWRFLTGLEVDSVFATSRSGSREDESAEVTARMTGGCMATASLSERAPHQIEVEVRGSEGRLRVDCLRFEGLYFQPAGSAPGDPAVRAAEARRLASSLALGVRAMRRGGDYLGSYARQWMHFREVALGLAAPLATVADGIENWAIARAAEASVRSGAVSCPLRSL